MDASENQEKENVAGEPSPAGLPNEEQTPRAVVGLGASAGGIKALQTFFGGMAPDSQLAFVVVMHLAPEYPSNLAEIIQLRTPMPVVQVNLRERVLANHIYVIPPGKQLMMKDGYLVASELQQPMASNEELRAMNEELTTANYELKSSVEDLRRANSDLQNLLAATDIGSIFLDRSLYIERFTPAVQEIFNLREHDIGRPLSDLTNHIDCAGLEEDARSVLRDLVKIEREVRSRQNQWFLARLLPYRSVEDRIDGVILNFVDITARKKAEEALRESEARFRQFAENSTDVLWILDAKSRQLEYLSPAFEQTWGEPRETLMRDFSKLENLVHPEDVAEVQHSLPRVLAGETVVLDYRIIRPHDGQIRWIRGTGFPIRDQEDTVVRIAGLTQDITEEKERTEALHASEERFRLLVEGAQDYAMFLLDPGNHIVHWNSGAERVFGWKAEEVIGESGEIIFTPEDRKMKMEEKEMQTALRESRAMDRRWHLRKDGSRIWVDGVMHRLVDEQTGALRGFAKIARDATDRRKIEDDLVRAHDELEQRVRERTAELQKMNDALETEMELRHSLEREILHVTERERARIGQDLHDSLCQELTATAFLLKSRAKSLGRQDPEAAEALDEAAHTVNQNAGLARDLARGMHPFELGSGGLASALRELCSRTQERLHCRCECPRTFRVEENIAVNLYRIAQEAVANVGKHAQASEVTIKLAREGNEIVLSVADNGKALKGKLRQGLGVHMMQYRANAIGAHLSIESKRSAGTTVTCRVNSKTKNPGRGKKRAPASRKDQ